MAFISGGDFRMGSERFYPEEKPCRRVRVSPFWIDETPVTNAEFARFVAETDYVTFAETAPDPRDYPGLLPEMAKPGSAVFRKTSRPVPTNNPLQWWAFTIGADWRHPFGSGSSIEKLELHPVVHVTVADAEAYAAWAGKSLPTEAEWEFAARGGLIDAEYAWGDELTPGGKIMANTWFGQFPHKNNSPHGWKRTSPVRSFPANGYGLYDMIGNVWEWTADWYGQPGAQSSSCCTADNPRGASREASYDSRSNFPRRVLKGGSHLCAPNYCQRYRPAARHPETIDTSTSHIGFRCVKRPAENELA